MYSQGSTLLVHWPDPCQIFSVSLTGYNTGGAGKGNRTLILCLEGRRTSRCAIPAFNTVKLVYTEKQSVFALARSLFYLVRQSLRLIYSE